MFAEVADTCKLQTKQVSVTCRAAVASSVGPGLFRSLRSDVTVFCRHGYTVGPGFICHL